MYKIEDKEISEEDFVAALKKAGIEIGDKVFVHSDISVFGKLATTDRDFLLGGLIDSIKENVGENGTIIMPTFTYSFCKNEMYDVNNSRSTVGTLTEYFRKQEGVVRNMHPIFSCAIWGRNKEDFLKISKNSFGKDSVFEKLHKMNGKIIFFGAPFQSCTFIHYIEKSYGVSYRYMKKFKGIIRDGEKEYEDEYEYFVRSLNKNVESDFSRLEKHLLDNKLMKEVKVGRGRILAIDCNTLFEEGKKMLDKDVFFLLKEVPDL